MFETVLLAIGVFAGTRLAAWFLAALVATVLATASPAIAAAPHGFVGMNAEEVSWEGPEAQNASLARMRANGVTQLRVIWRWANVENVRGVYKWEQLDQLTLNAARNDIKILPLVGGETPWATSRPAGDDRRCLFAPRNYADFAGWMRLVVQRYGPGGLLWQLNPHLQSYALTRWQMWNEPNKDKFWDCKANARQYVELSRQAANAIHSVDPDASIIAAGGPREGKPGTYLRNMFKHGAKKVFDRLSLHAYKQDADAMVAEVKKMREHMKDLGVGGWKLLVTEFGWATGFPAGDHSVGNDEAKQGRLLKNTFVKLGNQRKKLKLGSLTWYAWRDAPPPTDFGGGPDYWGLHTGVLRLDGTAKPALAQLAAASGEID